MPWISKKELSNMKLQLKIHDANIYDMLKRLDAHKAEIETMKMLSTVRTVSMGEVNLSKLAIIVDKLSRKIESGQLAEDAADRLVQDILAAYCKKRDEKVNS